MLIQDKILCIYMVFFDSKINFFIKLKDKNENTQARSGDITQDNAISPTLFQFIDSVPP